MIKGGRVRLLTRSGLDWTKKFGDAVVAAFKGLPVREALIDGELVVENAAGASNFSSLQADLSEGRSDRFLFYAFDLLYLDGYDLREAPLVARKAALEKLVGQGAGALRLSGHFDEEWRRRAAARLPARPRRHRLEAARLPLQFRTRKGLDQIEMLGPPGVRGRRAYVPSTAAADAIGSLVLGVYEGDALRYVGRVGTGFSASTARALFARLEPMRIASSPFADRLSAEEARQVRFVRPELVAEVDFRAWTADGHLAPRLVRRAARG